MNESETLKESTKITVAKMSVEVGKCCFKIFNNYVFLKCARDRIQLIIRD